MTIDVSHTISMGHRLPDYNGLCKHPHGHNVQVVVSIAVESGFVDFKEVKAHLKELLADFDHAMVLYMHDPLVGLLHTMDFRVVTLNAHPTTEALAGYFFTSARQWDLGEADYEVEAVTVYETDSYSSTCTEANTVRRIS